MTEDQKFKWSWAILAGSVAVLSVPLYFFLGSFWQSIGYAALTGIFLTGFAVTVLEKLPFIRRFFT